VEGGGGEGPEQSRLCSSGNLEADVEVVEGVGPVLRRGNVPPFDLDAHGPSYRRLV
jgi:hypothetical protein